VKINNLKINGFGNLKNRDIELKKGINIVYGENEAGKSTLLKFIYCTLYGASRNKNGKDISDYEKYMPWDSGEYSGKMEYELDNNEKYEVFREFGKKNPKIYNEQLEDISKTFHINKTKGIEFFYEQTKIDEDLFKSTVMVEQGESRLDKSTQNTLIQKITNLISTGADNISYKKAIDKINKKLLEEVGTERTIGKPKNLIQEKIKELELQKINIEKNEEEIKYIEKEKLQLKTDIEKEENKNNLLKQIKTHKEQEKIEQEKIKTNEQMKQELEENISKLKQELNSITVEQTKNSKIKYIVLLALIVLTIAVEILLNNKLIFIAVALEAVVAMIMLLKEKAHNKQQLNEAEEKRHKIKTQIKLVEENKSNIETKIKSILMQIEEKANTVNNQIINEYSVKLELYEIKNILNKKYEEIQNEIINVENKIANLKLRQNTLSIEKSRLNSSSSNIELLEQEIEKAEKERTEILSLENSIKLAKEALEIAYEKAKQNITPEFTAKLKECISKISTNKYQNVNFSDENGLRIEIQNGDYVPVESLSIGTIDQMYLALRINSISEIVEEKLPIILDEAFAYYDNARLKNILKYINEEYAENQIIIFTCSNREQEALEEMNIEYNQIKI